MEPDEVKPPVNIFRPQYRELSAAEKERIDSLKTKAFDLLVTFNVDQDLKGKDRETSLAITKLEEAVMWAVKSLTK